MVIRCKKLYNATRTGALTYPSERAYFKCFAKNASVRV
jgi:hypothetical protein